MANNTPERPLRLERLLRLDCRFGRRDLLKIAAVVAALGGGVLEGSGMLFGSGPDEASSAPITDELPANARLIDQVISRAYMEAIRANDGVELRQILQEISLARPIELEQFRLPIHAGVGFHGPFSASLIVGSQGPEYMAKFDIRTYGLAGESLERVTPTVEGNQIQFICHPYQLSPGVAGTVDINVDAPQQNTQLRLSARHLGIWPGEAQDTSEAACVPGKQELHQQVLNQEREIMVVGRFDDSEGAILTLWGSHDPERLQRVLLPSERILVLDFPPTTDCVVAIVNTPSESWFSMTRWVNIGRQPWPISTELEPQPGQ